MTIEFPFTEVDDVGVVFGGIGNYDAVLAACPQEYYDDNEYSNLASKWCVKGLDPEQDLAGYALTAESKEDAIMQRRYIEAWLGSFRPRHEEKIAVCGWLLSIMLSKPD